MTYYKIKEELEEKARNLGFSRIKYAPAKVMQLWEDEIEYRKKLDKASMNYWSDKNLTSSYETIMKDGRTYIVTSYPYIPTKTDTDSKMGYVNAHYISYPKGKAAMQEVANILTTNGYDAIVDPPLPIKQIAYTSGIGSYGKNGLIHNDKDGSLMTLHLILTNIDLPHSDLDKNDITDCGDCKECVNACPNNAILDNGRVIASKCLRYYMLSSDIIPVDIRKKMGNRILGCEDCQICCPKNASKYKENDQIWLDNNTFDIMEILKNQHGLKQYMNQLGEIIGKNYARSRRIISMAIIIAGNSGDSSYVKQISQTLYHQHPPIRAHSAWALGQLDRKNAIPILEEALLKETDSKVVNEIKDALNKLDHDISKS